MTDALERPYQNADVRSIPDNHIYEVKEGVKGQAVRRSVRTTGHQDHYRLCYNIKRDQLTSISSQNSDS